MKHMSMPMPSRSARKIISDAVLAEYTVKAEEYIMQTQEMIALRRNAINRCAESDSVNMKEDGLTVILLRVLAHFQAHHRLLLDLHQEQHAFSFQELAAPVENPQSAPLISTQLNATSSHKNVQRY